jgi:hypothetical protein
MYIAVLFIHSWFRYVVFALGLWLLVLAVKGWRDRHETNWTPANEKVHVGFVAALDLQFLIGLLLYFVLSPITAAALSNMGAAMKDPTLRFFAVEHLFAMFLAVAVAHIGRVRSKRKHGRARFRTTTIMQIIWLVLTLAAIPWPFLDVGRPLFRM